MEGQALQIKMDRTFGKENQQRLLVRTTSDLIFTLENGTFITFFITYVGMYGNVEILEMFDQSNEQYQKHTIAVYDIQKQS